jgi:hypothetical protein
VLASSLPDYQNSTWNHLFGVILALAPGAAIKTVTAEQLSVYPNPTNSIVYLRNTNGAEVKVYNLSGELLRCIRESTIDLSGYPAGIYLLRIGDKTLKVKKT